MSTVKRRKRAPACWGLLPCKRNCRPSASSASAEEDSEPSWTSLHPDIIRLIAWRVLAGDIADYLRFRAVCPRWRSSTVCPRGRGVVDPRFHPRHWMMLPEGHRLYPGHVKLRGWVRFFNLRTGALARIRLPLFQDHFAIDSVDGILVLQRDQDMALRLLHPFTGDIIDLPSLATLLPQLTGLFSPIELSHYKEIFFLGVIRNFCTALSFSPEGVVTAMLALYASSLVPPRVAFATSEHQQWTLSSWETAQMDRTLSFQGKLYILTSGLQFFMVDPPQCEGTKKGSPLMLQPPKLIATCSQEKIDLPMHMVECDSEILLIGRTNPSMSHVLIYRLSDIIMGRFIPLNCIGGNSIFYANNRSLCVSSKAHPTIVADSVVGLQAFIEPDSINGVRLTPMFLGQYHLKSGKWSTAIGGDILRGPMPSPYSLVHHIYTCCHRMFWNKGQIYCQAAYHGKWGVKEKWRRGG